MRGLAGQNAGGLPAGFSRWQQVEKKRQSVVTSLYTEADFKP